MLFWETVFIASVTGSARKQGFSSLLDLVDPWVTAKYIKLDISDDQVLLNDSEWPASQNGSCAQLVQVVWAAHLVIRSVRPSIWDLSKRLCAIGAPVFPALHTSAS